MNQSVFYKHWGLWRTLAEDVIAATILQITAKRHHSGLQMRLANGSLASKTFQWHFKLEKNAHNETLRR